MLLNGLEPISRRKFLIVSAWGAIFAALPAASREVKAFSQVFGPRMNHDEFNSKRHLWLNGDAYHLAIEDYRRSGKIISSQFEIGANYEKAIFVYDSLKSKTEFDRFLVDNAIFIESRLARLGLIHETYLM